jgi:hypothetical protein
VALAAATATRSGHLSPLVIVLIVVLAAVLWLGSLYFKPYTSCGRCNGTARRGKAKRYGRCPRCKGQPERLRFGARMMHRNIRTK